MPVYLRSSYRDILNAIYTTGPFPFLKIMETMVFLIGSLLLIPSGILYAVSCDKREKITNIAFGLGIPAWFLILIAFGVSSNSFVYLIIPAFFMIPIMLFGTILFAESRNISNMKGEKIIHYKSGLRKTRVPASNRRAVSNINRRPITRVQRPQVNINRNTSPTMNRRSYPARNTAYNRSAPPSRAQANYGGQMRGPQKGYKYCSQCGTRLRISDKYCYRCGYPQWLK